MANMSEQKRKPKEAENGKAEHVLQEGARQKTTTGKERKSGSSGKRQCTVRCQRGNHGGRAKCAKKKRTK